MSNGLDTKKTGYRYLVLHLLCWAVVIVAPLFFHSSEDTWAMAWNRFVRGLAGPLACMFIFYLNYGWVVPRFMIKKRDWKTGKILGLDVVSDTDLTGKKVLIVDDICSAGGTFKFSAIKLKELGATDVALYVSHCEDNIQNGDLLKTDLISKIYTTDTILHIEDPKIEVIRNFRK